MFGFGKKRAPEAEKAQVIAIGQSVVEEVNAVLADWRANALETRRVMFDEMFAERLIEIVSVDDLSYEMMAELEALALTKNWIQGVETYVGEFWSMVGDEVAGVIDVIGIREDVSIHIYRNIEEVAEKLESNLNAAIEEAVKRWRSSNTACLSLLPLSPKRTV